MAKRVGVILSGCGVYDGAEIHESVITLLALDRQGAQTVICAPDQPQMHVINHLTGEEEPGEGDQVKRGGKVSRDEPGGVEVDRDGAPGKGGETLDKGRKDAGHGRWVGSRCKGPFPADGEGPGGQEEPHGKQRDESLPQDRVVEKEQLEIHHGAVNQEGEPGTVAEAVQ